LIFDIVSYDCLGGVQTDGVDVISACPERSTPQHPLDLRVLFENSSRRDALDRLYDVLGRCRGDRLYEQVHMIAVGADFEKVDIIAILYSKAGFSDCFDHTVGQYFPTILHRTYDVIQQAGFVVALAYMAVLHATNIHRIALTSQQAARQSVLVYAFIGLLVH